MAGGKMNSNNQSNMATFIHLYKTALTYGVSVKEFKTIEPNIYIIHFCDSSHALGLCIFLMPQEDCDKFSEIADKYLESLEV
jgi:hypothetical protein